ncbi:MAG TPA: DUF4168 domain-containing protein [Nodosilinea sp.]|nr:DUF4168 domain-containing protein [Nodosilinea sp.]
MESVLGCFAMGYSCLSAIVKALLTGLPSVSLPKPWQCSWVGLSLSVFLLVGPGAPAIAAPAMPPLEDPVPLATPAADANDIPSETVSRFVRTYMAVVKLIESRELSLQRAETDTESRQMQQEIQAAALDLIEANGLTLSAYWELLGLANNDPEFRDRVLAQIDEANF